MAGLGGALVVGGLVATGLVLTGGDDPAEVTAGPIGSMTPAAGDAMAVPHPCPADEGSAIDVAHEPDWRQHAGYADWTDEALCLVRIDVLAELPGSAHCGYQDATVLVTGRPLGARYTRSSDDQQYIRDPDGVMGDPALQAGFDPHATLPSGAIDSGFRRGDDALWYDPADPSAVWMVGPDRFERWPAGESPLCM